MVSYEEKELLAERLVTRNLYKLKQLSALLQPEELAEVINTSKEIDFTKVFQVLDAEKAVKAVHTAFGLNADGEAVVYGGTGR